MIALPGYVDKEAWEGFREMRATIKKPLTVRAAKMILYELQRIKDAGHCPNAALDQSTNHCWADVYPAKEKAIEVNRATEAERSAQYLAERSKPQTPEEQARAAEAREMARKRLRRVA